MARAVRDDREAGTRQLPRLAAGEMETLQIYHMNLLKRWHKRMALAVLWPGPRIPTLPVVVPSNEDLDQAQKQMLREPNDRDTAVFSEKLGRTTLIEHHVHIWPGETVRNRPYRIPEDRRKAVKQGLEVTLRMGLSKSPTAHVAAPSCWCPNRMVACFSVMTSGV
jgi:hypothetical protein